MLAQPDFSTRTRLFLAGGLVLLALLQGFNFSGSDLDTYIPFILHESDPSLFANDLLIQTINDHPVVVWKAAGWLTSVTSLEFTLVTLWLGQTFLIAAALWFFYRHFFGPGNGALVFLAMLCLAHGAAAMSRYGLNPYHYFQPHVVGLSLLLLSYTWFDQGRRLLAGGTAGFIFLIHPFSAVATAAVLGWRFLLDAWRDRQTLPGSLASGATLLVIASPAWLPFLLHKLDAPVIPFDVNIWLDFVRARMNHSFFLSSWVPERFVFLGLMAVVTLWGFRNHPVWYRLLPFTLAVLSLLLLMALGEWLSVGLILQLQLARLSYLITLVAVAFMIHHLLTKQEPGNKWLTGATLLFLGWYAVENTFSPAPGPARLLLMAGILATVFIGLFRPKWWISAFLILVLMGGLARISGQWIRYGQPILMSQGSDWVDIQQKTRELTPANAVILSPSYMEGFRYHSHRAIVGTYKDGAPHNYSKSTFAEYLRRMELIGYRTPWDRKDLPALYHQHAGSAARQLGVRYVVIENRLATPTGPVLAGNASWSLIDLEISGVSSVTNSADIPTQSPTE